MSLELYAAFVAASVLLILIPGPNVALIVANSVAHGARSGLSTVAGTSAAMALQLTVTVLGLGGILAVLADWFEWLRWLGVGFLVYLGLKAWMAPAVRLEGAPQVAASPRLMVLRGFVVSLTNPKTLFFYGAFLPQFVAPTGDVVAQLALLATTFLIVAVVLDSGWALFAYQMRRVLGVHGRVLSRLTGGILLTAAAGLALARRT